MTSPLLDIESLAKGHHNAHWHGSKKNSILDDMSVYWFSMALLLHFPLDDVLAIQRKCSSVHQCFHEVILQSLNSGKSWTELRYAFLEVSPGNADKFDIYQSDFDQMCRSIGNPISSKFGACQYGVQVNAEDLPDILIILNKHCPTKWREIGRRLLLSEGELEKINVDEYGSENKACAMLSACIHNKNITWQDLIDAIKTITFSYKSLNDDYVHEHKEEMLKRKNAAVRGLRELLKVTEEVCDDDDDLLVGFCTHIRAANLHTEQVEEVVTTLEILENCMGQYNKSIKKWAVNLQKDLNTVRYVQTSLTNRKQDLKRLQSKLMAINGGSWTQDTSDRLGSVNVELKEVIQELDRANADYRAISEKLNDCQIELEKSINQYEQVHGAIESFRGYTREREVWWECLLKCVRCNMGTTSESVRDEQLQKVTNSIVRRLKESKEELDTIQRILNEAKHL